MDNASLSAIFAILQPFVFQYQRSKATFSPRKPIKFFIFNSSQLETAMSVCSSKKIIVVTKGFILNHCSDECSFRLFPQGLWGCDLARRIATSRIPNPEEHQGPPALTTPRASLRHGCLLINGIKNFPHLVATKKKVCFDLSYNSPLPNPRI